MVLADGSCVRLSSESSIRFPESFSDSLREVEIEGEAYLEVKKDSTRPFIVHVKELKIEVLGTRFGVRVYQDESMASNDFSGRAGACRRREVKGGVSPRANRPTGQKENCESERWM